MLSRIELSDRRPSEEESDAAGELDSLERDRHLANIHQLDKLKLLGIGKASPSFHVGEGGRMIHDLADSKRLVLRPVCAASDDSQVR